MASVRVAHYARHATNAAGEPWRHEPTLDALYREHAGGARRLARSLTASIQDADDLVAEAFVRMLAAMRRGGGPTDDVRAYLFATMRRLRAESLRRPVVLEPTGNLEAAEAGSAELVSDDHSDEIVESDAVTRAFQSLPERWRQVLALTCIEDLSSEQVATQLGVTPGAAAVLAFRAREGLRAAYLQQGVPLAEIEDCRDTRVRMGRWARGKLGIRERMRVEAHLERCADCRAVALAVEGEAARMQGLAVPVLMLGVAAMVRDGALIGLPTLGSHAAGAGPLVGLNGSGGSGGAGGSSSPVSTPMVVAAALAAALVAGGLAVKFAPTGADASRSPRAGASQFPSDNSAPDVPALGNPLPASKGSEQVGNGTTDPAGVDPALAVLPVSLRPAASGPELGAGSPTPSPAHVPSPAPGKSGSGPTPSPTATPPAAMVEVRVVFVDDAQRSRVIWDHVMSTTTTLRIDSLPSGGRVTADGAVCSPGPAPDQATCSLEASGSLAGAQPVMVSISAPGWTCRAYRFGWGGTPDQGIRTVQLRCTPA